MGYDIYTDEGYQTHITFNHNETLKRVIGKTFGDLDGLKGSEIAPVMKKAILKLLEDEDLDLWELIPKWDGDKPKIDGWAVTPNNCLLRCEEVYHESKRNPTAVWRFHG